MIEQYSRRPAGGFLHRALHCILFLLARGIWPSPVSRKMVKTLGIAKICFHGVEHRPFIAELAHADFTERQQIVRDEAPDKHGDTAENAREENFHREEG